MSHQSPLSQWMETVSTMLPKLSRPQAMVLARSCGITLVCAALALQVDSGEQSLLHRLREWCYGAEDKKGKQRRELDVSTCFGPLLQWILAWWPADEPRLALALDASTPSQQKYSVVPKRYGSISSVLMSRDSMVWETARGRDGMRV